MYPNNFGQCHQHFIQNQTLIQIIHNILNLIKIKLIFYSKKRTYEWRYCNIKSYYLYYYSFKIKKKKMALPNFTGFGH